MITVWPKRRCSDADDLQMACLLVVVAAIKSDRASIMVKRRTKEDSRQHGAAASVFTN